MKVSRGTRLLDNNFYLRKIIPDKIFSVFRGHEIIFHPNLQLTKRCFKNIDNISICYKELVSLWQNTNSTFTIGNGILLPLL